MSGVNVKLNYRASPEYMKQSESDDCALYILLFLSTYSITGKCIIDVNYLCIASVFFTFEFLVQVFKICSSTSFQ